MVMIAAVSLVYGWDGLSHDIDISDDPVQKPYEGAPITRDIGGRIYTFTPVAEYELSAKVVSVQPYDTDFSPLDVCTAWGKWLMKLK